MAKVNLELVAISGEYLVQLFQDKNFLAKVRKTSFISQRTEYEAGFEVCQLMFELKYGVGTVRQGIVKGTMEGSEDIEDDPNLFCGSAIPFKRERYDHYELIRLHSHPYIDFILNYGPSYVDLTALRRVRKYHRADGMDIKPIGVILTQTKKGKPINLLLIQENTNNPLKKILIKEYVMRPLEDIVDKETNTPEEDVARILRETGLYNAEVVRITQGKYEGNILKKLKKFAFVPKVLDENMLYLYQSGRLD